ncbi:uncharacterized protein RHOBADRAFT_53255 [Rhodotorula graminis WP1]|uniref:Uncharacterized protein n=1 Tax=Rhodotorula graminis (strain WP1) TaxID=578459 RepID=A0A194S404_RHOGW|nr:uncharacterized protein RHOBADRAFT_53255 [Rhodotorula graminis WP1]KPV75254.1 hypothetical protein RHOBADRAFT_53255 [Rhodotorula graminis WP1]
MGIGGLLPLLKEIQHTAHVREWAGKTVAVDAYVWLHRGAYGCAEDLALGKPTTKYANYAMHRVRMLKHFGVTPILVFDGGLLPSKMGTEDAREAKRADALARGRAFLAEGKGAQARECFVKAVDVTPAMAFQLIKALRREKVQYIVAPYEADPQLAYLERTGLVDAVVTEDSDLLVFGCRNVLFKLDGEGNCVSISRDDFARCRDFNFAGWSEVEFRQMAILSGCDYLDSVVGLGLKTAYRLLRKYKTPEKVIQFVRLEGQLTVPRTYLDEFRRAEKTFLHQHVFDPVKRELVHLTPLPDGITAADLPFIGPVLDGDYARGVADGDIDPITKLAMVDLVPESGPSTSAPYKPQPFKRSTGPTSSTAKSAAGSLLSYFSPAPAASTSSAAPSNPAKAAKARAKVTLVAGSSSSSVKRKGKQKDEEPQEARQSKFFGATAASAKGKGKARAVEVPLVEEEALGLAADDSGFLECLELPPCSDDLDAEAALRETEFSVEMRSVVAVEEEDETPPALAPPPADAAPLLLSSTPAISSPPATPPRKRAKLVHSPSAALDVPVTGPPSEAGISSPAQSTVAQAGWDHDELSSPIHAPAAVATGAVAAATAGKLERASEPEVKREEPQQQQLAATPTIELSSDPILLSSSPGAAPTPRPSVSTRDIKPASPLKGKAKVKAKVKAKAPARSSQGKTKASPRRSNVVGVEVRADEVAPPSSSSSSASSSAAKAVKASGSGSAKRRKRVKEEQVDEDEDEGQDEAAKALAASWRAKFMLPAATKTPLGRSSLGRPSPPTPQTAARPPASPKKRSASTDLSRPPLSPRSRNRTSSSTSAAVVAPPPPPMRTRSPLKQLQRPPPPPQEDVVPAPAIAPPAKKRRTSAHGPPALAALPSSPPQSSDGILSSAPDDASSSPVVVTNPRLLAFRFTGSVRRN